MIDILSGEFRTDDGFAISPKSTEQEFLSSPVGALSKYDGSNDGWSRYYLPAPQVANKIMWACYLIFLNGRAKQLSISTYDPMSRGWADWSEANELLTKNRHDSILFRLLGQPPYLYNWGEVFSAYDKKGGSAHITIRWT